MTTHISQPLDLVMRRLIDNFTLEQEQALSKQPDGNGTTNAHQTPDRTKPKTTRKLIVDPELQVMNVAARRLDELSDDAQGRVIGWLSARYHERAARPQIDHQFAAEEVINGD